MIQIAMLMTRRRDAIENTPLTVWRGSFLIVRRGRARFIVRIYLVCRTLPLQAIEIGGSWRDLLKRGGRGIREIGIWVERGREKREIWMMIIGFDGHLKRVANGERREYIDSIMGYMRRF
jgi:hypothetical protein